MIKKFNTYNESIRDMMKPKSKEEVEKAIGNLVPNAKLISAAENGIDWIIQKALDEGADIHHQEDLALKSACDNGHEKSAKILLDNGADIHTNKDSVLLYASWKNNYNIIKLLLEYGADIHADDDNSIGSVIEKITITKTDNIETIKLLLDHGATPKERDKKFAKAYKRLDIINLLNKYMTTNESIRDQMKPKSKEDIIKIISKLDPDTRLVMGCRHGLLDVIKNALKAGANIHYLNGHPIRVACQEKNLEIIKYLLEHGAETNDISINWVISLDDPITAVIMLNRGGTLDIKRDELQLN